MKPTCCHPECSSQAVIVMGHSASPLSGAMCLAHADSLMATLRKEVPKTEGDFGWKKWLKDTEYLRAAS